MGLTIRLLSLLTAAALFAFGWSAMAAPSAPSTTSTPIVNSTPIPAAATSTTGEYKVADYWDRICCRRYGQEWWTTRRGCYSYGGHEVSEWACRRDNDDDGDDWGDDDDGDDDGDDD